MKYNSHMIHSDDASTFWDIIKQQQYQMTGENIEDINIQIINTNKQSSMLHNHNQILTQEYIPAVWVEDNVLYLDKNEKQHEKLSFLNNNNFNFKNIFNIFYNFDNTTQTLTFLCDIQERLNQDDFKKVVQNGFNGTKEEYFLYRDYL